MLVVLLNFYVLFCFVFISFLLHFSVFAQLQGCDLLVQVVMVNYFVIFIVDVFDIFFNDGSCLIHIVALTTGITIITFTAAIRASCLEPPADLYDVLVIKRNKY